ncbi:vitamin K epoxide reductase family protein, partial [Methylicorpusculum sp.]|uniref:vitamin K epoxide reductase family protein n=1 Tax=Methylicorpusculum sp. TaxID=2713644 RepID=UPI002ABC0414
GFVVSLYAYFIEKKIAQNAAYKPFCDISATISCSKPILSSYGKLFGISNALLGVGYYFVFLVLLVLQAKITLYVLALIAFLLFCMVALFSCSGVLYSVYDHLCDKYSFAFAQLYIHAIKSFFLT